MKAVLIVIGIVFLIVYMFVLYCCIAVGANADKAFSKLEKDEKSEK